MSILCFCATPDLHPHHLSRPLAPPGSQQAPQSPPINPLWKPSAHQVKLNQHDFPIFTSLCCSETCYATLLVSAQSYDISELPIPPVPDASDGHFPLCTPPPKATQTLHLLECALHSPLLVISGMDFDIFNTVTVHPPGANRTKAFIPPQGPLQFGPAPCIQNTSILYPPCHMGHCSHPPSFNVHLHLSIFLGSGFLHKDPIHAICLPESYLGFKMHLEHNFLQEVFQALHSSLISFSKFPFSTIFFFAMDYHKAFIIPSWVRWRGGR